MLKLPFVMFKKVDIIFPSKPIETRYHKLLLIFLFFKNRLTFNFTLPCKNKE